MEESDKMLKTPKGLTESPKLPFSKGGVQAEPSPHKLRIKKCIKTKEFTASQQEVF